MKTVDRSCDCDVFRDSPCTATATQEDLLCDPCRLLRARSAALGTPGSPRATGAHQGGPPWSPRPHLQWDPA